MKAFILILSVVAFSGCWLSKKRACESWLKSGEVASSYDQCIKCASAYGTGDVRTVRDCAFKKDIGQIRDGF